MDDLSRNLGKAPSGRLQGYRVLVVDRDAHHRRELRSLLLREGARVLEASDGAEALREAIRWQPDLIAFDPSSVGDAGPATYRALRRDPRIDDIPVCLWTERPDLRPRLCDQGVRCPDGLFLKPLETEHAVATMTRVLRIHGRWWSRRVAVEAPSNGDLDGLRLR